MDAHTNLPIPFGTSLSRYENAMRMRRRIEVMTTTWEGVTRWMRNGAIVPPVCFKMAMMEPGAAHLMAHAAQVEADRIAIQRIGANS